MTHQTPSWLTDVAKKLYQKLSKEIDMNPVRVELLAVLCANYANWRRCQDVIDGPDGILMAGYNNQTKMNPVINAAKIFHTDMCKMAAQLEISKDKLVDDDDDEVEERGDDND